MTKHDIFRELVPITKKLEDALPLALNTVQMQQSGSACDVRDMIIDLQARTRRIVEGVRKDLVKDYKRNDVSKMNVLTGGFD